MAESYTLSRFNNPVSPATSYDIHLTITREDISKILKHCLEQKISHQTDNTENVLKIAECIKTSQLSDDFCDQFSKELGAVLQKIIGTACDSYEVANFQHRMLRTFANYRPLAGKQNER